MSVPHCLVSWTAAASSLGFRFSRFRCLPGPWHRFLPPFEVRGARRLFRDSLAAGDGKEFKLVEQMAYSSLRYLVFGATLGFIGIAKLEVDIFAHLLELLRALSCHLCETAKLNEWSHRAILEFLRFKFALKITETDPRLMDRFECRLSRRSEFCEQRFIASVALGFFMPILACGAAIHF